MNTTRAHALALGAAVLIGCASAGGLGGQQLALAVAIPDVCAIQVMSPRFVTAEGLSVSSTAGAWEEAFGPLTYDGDTGLYEPGAGASGYGLILDTESEPPEDDADVVAIRIGACPI